MQPSTQPTIRQVLSARPESDGRRRRHGALQGHDGKFSGLDAFGGIGGLFGQKSAATLEAADIDSYVTGKALDGLFKMVAEEEKSIRANPADRTSDLLQRVLGSSMK